ncbi:MULTISPECIES: hypothetical protein [Salinibacter]|uniref:hypothetical protein n=1 Tax=Salinibacter TaxID=146918 RepID=UPI001ABB64CA|nr:MULTISPECIES: hypothetical protein [Salinibacter]
MTMLQDRLSVRCAQMEDGEVIGTIQQLSNRFGLAESAVLPCLQDARQSVMLRAGTGLDQLLILEAGAPEVLRDCAGSDAAGP